MSALDFPTSPSDGDTYEGYVYNAAKGVWQWQTLTPSLVSLTDTDISSPASGEVLEYDGTNWVNAAGGGGKVLQVVSATKTDTFTISSSTYQTITDLSVSITPISATSQVFILFSVPIAYGDNSTRSARLSVFKDGSNLIVPDSPGSRTVSQIAWNGYSQRNETNHQQLISGSILDSPATTSSVTYDLRGSYAFAAARPNMYINRSDADTNNSDFTRGVATLTVMEIAG